MKLDQCCQRQRL